MTSLERHEAFFRGDSMDRPLNQPLVMALAARMAGITYRQAVTDGDAWARMMLAAADTLGLDVLSVCSDPVREAHDLGAELVWFDHDPPAPDPTNHLLQDPGRFESLDWSVTGSRMDDRLQAIRRLKSDGEDVRPILGWVEGPSS
ncbi:MAG: hypothetical protein MH204_11110, partial [Fimbriimonadaceae bacterium]|nr:hypothetical protein [Fimbriimonadaceae bacterium]